MSHRLFVLLAAPLAVAACKVGPDFEAPAAPVADAFLDPGDAAVRREPEDISVWWKTFGDPALDRLIETAQSNNPTLHEAGLRVLQGQAVRGVAFGALFPQRQEASGEFAREHQSSDRGSPFADHSFQTWQLGVGAAWELDFWGRFRRGVEAADAEVLASFAGYDDVMVSLVADVASGYLSLRSLEERLVVARANVEIQGRSLDIAQARFDAGSSSELDVAQATALLRDTQSLIPAFEAGIRATEDVLCVLLGTPPRDLRDLLGPLGNIPAPPESVAVGIPADLLRRRPDVRRAEHAVAAQCARIGIAKADLLPSISVFGSATIDATDRDFARVDNDLDDSSSFTVIGAGFRWPILNYGRIINNVRAQDALFEAQVAAYVSTVLEAQGEVASAIAAFIGARRQVVLLAESVAAARRGVAIAEEQYRGGTADYTRVLDTQQFLAAEQDKWVSVRGQVALNAVALYRALGGGWESRVGDPLVPQHIKDEMRDRTWWGGMIDGDHEGGTAP